MRSTLDDIRDDVRGMRDDLREDVNGLHAKLDKLIEAHGETRERVAALEAITPATPSSRSRVQKYAPAGLLAAALTLAVEGGPAVIRWLSTKDAVAQTHEGK